MIHRRKAPRGFRELEGGLLIPSRMSGHFKLDAIRPDGRRRPLTGWFDNLILDRGLDHIGQSAVWMGRCAVGTGNGAPANSDTTLDSQVASTTNVTDSDTTNSGASEYYTARTNVYRFATGNAEGNIAEVGIGRSSGDTALFSRALILDGDGNPITVTVLADEALDVTYQLRNYPILTDVNDTINISGSDYDITIRASEVDQVSTWGGVQNGCQGGSGGTGGVTAYSGAIGATTGSPAGSSDAVTPTNAAYSDGNFYRDFTATWGLAEAAFGNIRSVRAELGTGVTSGGSINNMGAIQVEFDPVIPKTGSNQLALQFRHSWTRRSI